MKLRQFVNEAIDVLNTVGDVEMSVLERCDSHQTRNLSIKSAMLVKDHDLHDGHGVVKQEKFQLVLLP